MLWAAARDGVRMRGGRTQPPAALGASFPCGEASWAPSTVADVMARPIMTVLPTVAGAVGCPLLAFGVRSETPCFGT